MELLLLIMSTPNHTITSNMNNWQFTRSKNIEYPIQDIIAIYDEMDDQTQQRNGTASISAYSRSDMRASS